MSNKVGPASPQGAPDRLGGCTVMRDRGILGHVGGTPLVLLRNSSPNPGVRIWAKLEFCNPSGSLKDRIALRMVEEAERQGRLRPGMTIIEATSGNTGIALGMVAAVKGYRLRLFMSEAKTVERRKMLRAWGAELVLTPKEDPDGHIWAAKRLAREEPDRYFHIDQNENEENVRAHYEGTGREIVEQRDGRIDGFFAGFGTGGCLMGVAGRLQDEGLDAKIYAVEPDRPAGGIDGLKNGAEAYQPPIYDRRKISRTLGIGLEEALEAARSIARNEGILVGLSSGAVLHAARRVASEMDRGDLVVLFGDRGERYFSTRLFEPA